MSEKKDLSKPEEWELAEEKEEFFNPVRLYEEIYQHYELHKQQQRANELRAEAMEKYPENGGELFDEALVKLNSAMDAKTGVTNFTGMEKVLPSAHKNLGLYCSSEWYANDDGVYKFIQRNGVDIRVYASPVPILIYAKSQNIITNKVKYSVAFGDKLKTRMTVSGKTIAGQREIMELADYGLGITSENAKPLTVYLASIINHPDNSLPVSKSISHLGWIKDANGNQLTNNLREAAFLPYNTEGFIECDNVDGGDFGEVYKAVSQSKGTLSDWIERMKPLRQHKEFRIMFAASFASVLIEPCGAHPFIAHIVGESGSGKSTTNTITASIWGNPADGKYMQSLDATVNSMMGYAEFMNSLPCYYDELQTLAENKTSRFKTGEKSFDDVVYKLAEGIGRGRSDIHGNPLPRKSWRCAFFFSGEEPIIKSSSKEGVRNRVLQFQHERPLFDMAEADALKRFVLSNYGTAGREFVVRLSALPVDTIIDAYEQSKLDMQKALPDTPTKQYEIGALLLTADRFAREYIWGEDDYALTAEDFTDILRSTKDANLPKQAYDAVMSIVSQNVNRFGAIKYNRVMSDPDTGIADNFNGIQWGRIDTTKRMIYFEYGALREQLGQLGYDFDLVKTEWGKRGYIKIANDGKVRYTHRKTINGVPSQYVVFYMPDDDENE